MPNHTPSSSDTRAALLALAAFILAMAAWDWMRISFVDDTILPPTLLDRPWAALGDWSAVHVYADAWPAALLRALARWSAVGAIAALSVLAIHALLWSGVYYAAGALLAGGPWLPLLAVALVRTMPDLFGVRLLAATPPDRALAVALAFWSVGLAIQRRWILACLVGGLMAHVSVTMALWFAQFLFVIVFCLNYEWGWRTSLAGAVAFLALATGPLVRFLLGELIPDAPLPDRAMLGVHFFADPRLSPFNQPLWAIVCLIVYVAIGYVWLKQYFNRQTYPVVVILSLIGCAGWLLEIVFVGLIPIERAVRFELPNARAFWLLWFPVFYAPALGERLRASWRGSGKVWPLLSALTFSVPVAWSALQLIERLRQPPRWRLPLVVALLGLLIVTAFVLPHAPLSIIEPLFTLAIALACLPILAGVWAAQRTRQAARTVGALAAALVLFAALGALLHGRDLAALHEVPERHRAWNAALQWIESRTPPDAKWAIPARPRAFRLATGRPVLVNAGEIPREPQARVEWFERFVDTHTWRGAPHLGVPPPTDREAIARALADYAASFLFGGVGPSPAAHNQVVPSHKLVASYGARYLLLHQDAWSPPRAGEPAAALVLERLHQTGPFLIVQIREADSATP